MLIHCFGIDWMAVAVQKLLVYGLGGLNLVGVLVENYFAKILFVCG